MKIVRIGALWCPSCLIMRPRWKQVETELSLSNIIDYDYDMNETEIEKYAVGKILPVVIFFDENNNEIERLIGEKTKEQIIETINSLKERHN